jgi:hypothetical protein
LRWQQEEEVRLITNMLFSVNFSRSCIAMGAYVKRVAPIFGAQVSMIHVFDSTAPEFNFLPHAGRWPHAE